VKLAVVGSRQFEEQYYDDVRDLLESIVNNYDVKLIISGGARGIDSLAERFADEQNISKSIFPAQWDKYGKSAGYIRNQLIVDNCDKLVAFWDGKSKGTEHSINLAKEQSKLLKIYILNGATWTRRIT
jgi:hypothetical protein